MSVKPDFVCFCQNMPKFEKDTTCALCYHFENEYKQKKEHCYDKLIFFFIGLSFHLLPKRKFIDRLDQWKLPNIVFVQFSKCK